MSQQKDTKDSHGKEHPRKVGAQFAERARSRRRALQALYQWQMTGQSSSTIAKQFFEEQDMSIADDDYFRDLLSGVERQQDELDAGLQPLLDRPLEQVDPIERAVLRLAAYELRSRLDVPYRVVLNEAIDLAKDFGSEGGHTYVNGVLDKAALLWRATEFTAEHKHPVDSLAKANK
jgi:transcription antitermination protein NusB